MDNGKDCPNCGRDIGMWAIFSASLPNRIKCPHCSARLTYQDIRRLLIILAILTVAVIAGSMYIVSQISTLRSIWEKLMVFSILLIVLWIPIEYFTALFLRTRKALKRVD